MALVSASSIALKTTTGSTASCSAAPENRITLNSHGRTAMTLGGLRAKTTSSSSTFPIGLIGKPLSCGCGNTVFRRCDPSILFGTCTASRSRIATDIASSCKTAIGPTTEPALPHHHPGVQGNAPIEIDDVLVHHTDASRRDCLSDRCRFGRAVDAITGVLPALEEVERTRAERVAL